MFCRSLGEIGTVRSLFNRLFQWFQTVPGKRLYLSRLIVKKECRGKGYGKAITQHILTLAKKKGYREIALGVNRDNTGAVRLYEKLGFTVYEEAEDEDGKFYRMIKQLNEELS